LSSVIKKTEVIGGKNMLFCKQCNKTYLSGKNFCPDCGSALELLPDTNDINEKTENQQLVLKNLLPCSDTKSKKVKKTGAAAVICMFIINLIPIIGFPLAFIWAWSKYKSFKIKLVGLMVLFIILNVTATIFGYALAISHMENSLAKAAGINSNASVAYQMNMPSVTTAATNPESSYQQQNSTTSDVLSGIMGPDAFPDSGIEAEDNILEDIPEIDIGVYQDIAGIGPGMAGMFIPDFSSYTGGIDSYPAEDVVIPEGVNMPVTGEHGNMDIDYHGDNSGTGSNSFSVDEEGNVYIDSDGDGKYDYYMDKHGNVVPLDSSIKVDEHGNRYYDHNRDGKYDYYIDNEGTSHYDLDGDGVFETTFEAEYGQG
jgi:hypothetical protein